jgi:predicted nucleotidyltransferase
MLLQDLEKRSLIKPPTWLVSNTCYLTRMGSVAYGVSSNNSDLDIYGVCIPPRDYIFPQNYIDGFDKKNLKFENWVQHHILDKSANAGKGAEYDFSIHNITHYFNLVMDNNPHVLDSLFVRREHIIHITRMWQVVRDNRKMFLHKGVVHRMRGYAYNQLASARNCVEYVQEIREFEELHNIPHTTTYEQVANTPNNIDVIFKLSDPDYSLYLSMWERGFNKTKRFESQKIHNTDVKFLYHVFRLVDEAEFILNHFDLDLQEPSRVAKMKAIRAGELTYDQIAREFSEAESRLLGLYNSSKLPKEPDRKAIRNILLAVLEDHYGSLSEFAKAEDAETEALKEIKLVLQKYNI